MNTRAFNLQHTAHVQHIINHAEQWLGCQKVAIAMIHSGNVHVLPWDTCLRHRLDSPVCVVWISVPSGTSLDTEVVAVMYA